MRAWWLVVALCAGCGDAIDDGAVGGHCFPNETCNAGLTCTNNICVPIDAAAPDAPIDAMCVDMFEPNDTVMSATDTGIMGTMGTNTRTLAAVICPNGDKDNFKVTITVAGFDLEALLDSDNALVDGSIINSNGTSIANAVPVSATRRRAHAPSLPLGTYYVMAFGGNTATSLNSYSLTVTASMGALRGDDGAARARR